VALKIGQESTFSPSIFQIRQTGSCYILANGPSLDKDINSVQLENQSVMVVNNFIFSDLFKIIKPQYYIIADFVYWTKSTIESTIREKSIFFEKLQQDVSWEMILLIPYVGYKTGVIQHHLESNKNIKIHYFNSTAAPVLSKIIFKIYKKNYAMPFLKNVLIGAIYTAMTIGFEEIHILGTDHSWLKQTIVNSNNQVCLDDVHFYNKTKNIQPWLRASGEPYKLHELLIDLSAMFSGYWELKKYADYLNVKIINHTEDSFIDAFERT
jgi:hypothetical protein